MDTETLKAIAPLLGGLMALVGGAFTFVNGRLRDAETTEQKNALLGKAGEWVALAPTLVGALLLFFFGAKYPVAVACFTLSYILQARLFVLKAEPLRRIDVVTFSVLSSVTAGSIAFALMYSIIDQVISNQMEMIKVQEKTILLLEKVQDNK